MIAEHTISWNAHHKLYRRALLAEAYTAYHGEYVNMWEDLLLSFLVMCRAGSYRVIGDRLYRYTVGSGMSTQDGPIGTDRMRAMLRDYSHVSRLLEADIATQPEALRPALESLLTQAQRQMSGRILDCLCRRCAAEQCRELLPALRDCFPYELFADFTVTYMNEHMRETQECLRQSQAYARGLEASPSYRIGRAVTALPRRLRGILGKK